MKSERISHLLGKSECIVAFRITTFSACSYILYLETKDDHTCNLKNDELNKYARNT